MMLAMRLLVALLLASCTQAPLGPSAGTSLPTTPAVASGEAESALGQLEGGRWYLSRGGVVDWILTGSQNRIQMRRIGDEIPTYVFRVLRREGDLTLLTNAGTHSGEFRASWYRQDAAGWFVFAASGTLTDFMSHPVDATNPLPTTASFHPFPDPLPAVSFDRFSPDITRWLEPTEPDPPWHASYPTLTRSPGLAAQEAYVFFDSEYPSWMGTWFLTARGSRVLQSAARPEVIALVTTTGERSPTVPTTTTVGALHGRWLDDNGDVLRHISPRNTSASSHQIPPELRGTWTVASATRASASLRLGATTFEYASSGQTWQGRAWYNGTGRLYLQSEGRRWHVVFARVDALSFLTFGLADFERHEWPRQGQTPGALMFRGEAPAWSLQNQWERDRSRLCPESTASDFHRLWLERAQSPWGLTIANALRPPTDSRNERLQATLNQLGVKLQCPIITERLTQDPCDPDPPSGPSIQLECPPGTEVNEAYANQHQCVHTVDRVRHGPFRTDYGDEIEMGCYRLGRPHGWLVRFRADGRLRYRRHFNDGRSVE